MHAVIAQKIRRDPKIVERARARVDAWVADRSMHPSYAERWRAVLALPTEVLAERLVARDEAMTALRQSTPFVGILDPQERWAIHRSVRREP